MAVLVGRRGRLVVRTPMVAAGVNAITPSQLNLNLKIWSAGKAQVGGRKFAARNFLSGKLKCQNARRFKNIGRLVSTTRPELRKGRSDARPDCTNLLCSSFFVPPESVTCFRVGI